MRIEIASKNAEIDVLRRQMVRVSLSALVIFLPLFFH